LVAFFARATVDLEKFRHGTPLTEINFYFTLCTTSCSLPNRRATLPFMHWDAVVQSAAESAEAKQRRRGAKQQPHQ